MTVVSGSAVIGGISYPVTASVMLPAAGAPQPSWAAAGSAYEQTFNDDFDGAALDTARWTPGWYGTGDTGPVNSAEQAAYSSSHVSVSSGCLHLLLTGDPVTSIGKTYPNTGALVSTEGLFSQAYGAFEFRAFLPAAPDGSVANWPALWAVGEDWPTDGEMDVMEGLSGTSQYHFISPSGNPGGPSSPQSLVGWHTFGAEWRAGRAAFYYDSELVGSITSGITSAPMHIVLDNTYGPPYSGPLVTPADMLVDWARAWA